jgi:hypothetical protein
MRSSLRGRLIPYALTLAAAAAIAYFVMSQRNDQASASSLHGVLGRALLTEKPKHCTSLYTVHILQQLEGKPGEQAVAECRQDTDGTPAADSYKVLRQNRQGPRAVVTVMVSGGELSGTVMTVGAVKAPSWKLDRLKKIDIEMAPFYRAQFESLRQEGLTPQESKCAVSRIRQSFSEAEVERSIIKGTSAALSRETIPCQKA